MDTPQNDLQIRESASDFCVPYIDVITISASAGTKTTPGAFRDIMDLLFFVHWPICCRLIRNVHLASTVSCTVVVSQILGPVFREKGSVVRPGQTESRQMGGGMEDFRE